MLIKKFFYAGIISTLFFIVFHARNVFAITEFVGLVRQDCSGYSNCFTSLAAWAKAKGGINFGSCNAGDLICADKIAVAQIDGNWTKADTDYVDIPGWSTANYSGWTTDSKHFIKIYTTLSARHSGKWDETKYRLEVYGNAFIIGADYVTIDGLQIKSTYSDSVQRGAFAFSPLTNKINEIRISHNILRGAVSSNADLNGILIKKDDQVSAKIWDNIFYDFSNNSFGYAILSSYNSNTNYIYFYNNTIYNCYGGIYNDGDLTAKNNLIVSTTKPATGTFDNGSDYNATDKANIGYTVTNDGNIHDRVGQNFVFSDAANNDFHLALNDTSAKDNGLNLSSDSNLSFSDDIDGQSRPSGSAWDIGADEYVSPPVVPTAPAALAPAAPPPPSVAPSAVPVARTLVIKTLFFGLKNDEVKNLQQILANPPLGGKTIYPEGLITGYFGPLTQKAVERFQCKYNIVCSGTPKTTGYGQVGPKTRTKLNE